MRNERLFSLCTELEAQKYGGFRRANICLACFLEWAFGYFPESTPVEYRLCVAASINIYSDVHLRAIQADESEVGANVLVNVLLKFATMKGMGGKSVHKMGSVINIYPPPEVIDAGEG